MHKMAIIALLVPLTSGFSSLPHDRHRLLELSKDTVHWGYFSKLLPPQLTIASGETVVVEMASHHACDDYDKMVKGDAGMESVFEWSSSVKGVSRRGATGGGDGVHVLTGPIYVEGAEPGDILSVEIVDLAPRPNAEGRTFGSNAAAWWGYQARSDKVGGTPHTPLRWAYPPPPHGVSHSLTHPLTHSLTPPPTRSLTHSPTHSSLVGRGRWTGRRSPRVSSPGTQPTTRW